MGWSNDPGDAYLFLERDLPSERSDGDWKVSAAAHVERLKLEGEVCRLVICDYTDPDGQARALKEHSRYEPVPAAHAPQRRRNRCRTRKKKAEGIPSDVVYAATQRRMGEHEE